MNPQKTKLEVLFRTFFQASVVNEDTIKKDLEKRIEGLRIKSIKVVDSKANPRAIVTSNILELLIEHDNSFEIQRRSTIASFIGPELREFSHSGAREKDTEKFEKEIALLKSQLAEEKKKAIMENVNQSQETILQKQVKYLNEQLEVLYLERIRVEDLNKELTRQVEILKLQQGFKKSKSVAIPKRNKETASVQTDEDYKGALDKLEELRKERDALRDRTAGVILRNMDREEELKNAKAKATLVEALKKSAEDLEMEKNSISRELQVKLKELEEKTQLCKENEEKMRVLRESLTERMKEVSEYKTEVEFHKSSCSERNILIESLNNSLSELNSKVESLENALTEREEENSELKAKLDALDKNNKALAETASRLETSNEVLVREKERLLKAKQEMDAVEAKRGTSKASSALIVKSKRLADENESLRQELSDAQAVLETKSQGILELQKDLTAKNGELEKLRAALEKASKEEQSEMPTASKSRELSIKMSEERKEKVERELIMLRAKYASVEKTLTEKGMELERLRASVLEASRTPEEPTANELQLRDTAAKQKKEIIELEEKLLGKITFSKKLKEELEEAKETIESLKSANKKLEGELRRRAESAEDVETLTRQRDAVAKENSSLKETLFKYENLVPTALDGMTVDGADKKVSIIEEIRQFITEVIYAYKTLGTNMKELLHVYEAKKARASDFRDKREKLLSAKSKEEASAILSGLENKEVFLKGFTDKTVQVKLIQNCLKEISIKRMSKIDIYEEEIAKFKAIVDISDGKIREYEENLALYY